MSPQPRKSSRPRLDAVTRHIRLGSYDDDIGQLQGAINDRQAKRKAEVLGIVEAVFGQGHTVVSESGPGRVAQQDFSANEVQPGDIPQVQPIPDDDDDNPDIESRSPLIGGGG